VSGDQVASRPRPIDSYAERSRHSASQDADYPAWLFPLGIVVNLLLRVMIIYFAAETVMLPDDERFAGKGLSIRNILIAVVFSMLFPFHYVLRKKWPRYPVWMDALYLSIFWFDMAGNSLNLFDMYEHFDALPHTWGPGALAVVFMWWQGWSALSAAGVATMIHAWLECEEYWGDLLFGTHNVRGVWDTVGDLGAGLAGVTAVIVASALITKWHPRHAIPEPVPQERQPIPFPTPRTARTS
jgi:hypothetical protein